MNRFLCATVVIAAALLIVSVAADAELDSVDKVEQVADEVQSTDVEEGRIRKHHLLYGGLLGGGLGGLHTLAVLYAIKVKILVVAAIVGLSVYYYSKFYKGGYETILPYETYSPYGPPGYSSHSSIIAESGPPGYTGYSNSGPYSAYAEDDHHDHDFSSFSHHAHGFDEHSAGDFADRSVMNPSGNGPSSSAADSTFNSSPSSPSSPAMSEPAVSRHKRQLNTGILENINWGEIAFQFLGVDTMGCRKRFVCELDFRAVRNPFTRLVYELIGKSFFDRYRDLSEDSQKPTKFEDCAKMYRECAAAAAYENNEEEEEEADASAAPTTEQSEHEPVQNGDAVEASEQPAKIDEAAEEPELNNEVGRMWNLGRLILLRADQ